MAVVAKTNGIPLWLVGEFTTHFRTYFSGWIELDVHWGLTGTLGFDPWPFPCVAAAMGAALLKIQKKASWWPTIGC